VVASPGRMFSELPSSTWKESEYRKYEVTKSCRMRHIANRKQRRNRAE
jgi:hypothetical protein